MTIFKFEKLVEFTSTILEKAGLESEKAKIASGIIVTADAMGHNTHGIAFLPIYIKALKEGVMNPNGQPEVLKDTGPILAWQGKRLSGIWLLDTALKLAAKRAKKFGLCTITIQEAHHTGCLAAFLPQITEQDLLVKIAVSGPSGKNVVPFGGKTPVLTPNPMAVGIPTNGTPILIDMSCSITSNTMAMKLREENKKFPGKWAQDADGVATDDPLALLNGGSHLMLGGKEYGHKGFALSLMIEAYTQGLAGYGRADKPTGSQGNVFIQIIDPEAFAGVDAFKRQTSHLVKACLESDPVDPDRPVRLPGSSAMKGLIDAKQNGVKLSKAIVAKLETLAEEFNVALEG
ncbi:Ldh family oxidoreductase [Aurantibacter sp.]|uniref:Ldh family oxidoreductase n=1 Tax=Aurantibacter sp. TaxID=2807103 RepID=UPI0032662689